MTASRSTAARLLSTIVLAAAAVAVHDTSLAAQYFGRNKVQYETFDFRVLKTENFDIYYYPEEEVAVRDAARMAERWYARLSRLLDHRFEKRQPLVLYASHPHFQQTVTTGGEIGEGTGGFTDFLKQRVVMPLAGSYEETDHVLGHEMVHAFQFDIAGFGREGAGGLEAAARRLAVPLWFTEGMAEYLSVGPIDPHTAMWVRDAALTGNIPTVEQMTYNPRFFPYRWGQAFWAYVGGRWGDAVVGQILKQVGQGVPYEEAFERILNTPLDEISDDWHTAIRRAYLPLLNERREAREIARPLITQRREGGQINLAPSLSPDGRWVAFLSELDFIDVELYLANAETGEVVRRLQKGTAFDPHFGSLRYIASAGTWSPAGDRFAFSALRKGSDHIIVIQVPSGRRLREYRIPGVSELTNPTWSPDGSTIVVSGNRGGITDLYALDVSTGKSRQLTTDRFADLHPAYSPDGRSVAFVTDRGGDTDFSELEYGSYRIAVLDVPTGEIRMVPGMGGGKNINPSWSRDGRSLYFISNRAGISNIFRVELATGALSRVTDLFTGVSGITDLSPALTTARSSDRLLFTAFEKNGYNIYSLTEPDELAGVAFTDTVPTVQGVPLAAVLPPTPRPPEAAFNRVLAMLGDETTGLPTPDTTWTVSDYGPHITLDYLGQPQVGVSTGSAYTRGGVYGGIAGIFSDVLGYHTIYGAVQAQGQIDEIGFSTIYLNRKHRWNFGAAAQRIPYIGLFRRTQFDQAEGRFEDQLIRFRYFDTSLQGIAQYPFSTVQRVEFSGGVRRISQDAQVQEISAPAEIGPDGQLIQTGPFQYREFEDPEFETAFNLAEGSAALVYDNALLGYTSPFAGQRYRFEISPTVGSVQYTQALADYRRYLFLRPFTLAVRGLHFGRYGRNAELTDEGQRLFQDLYLGQPYLMRGYFSAFGNCRESRLTDEQDCAIAQRLFGSRIAVVNAELRFPLLRQVVVGTAFGLPPVEGFAFFDAGTAWDQDSEVVFERGLREDVSERGILTSAGVGGRVNLFGYLILEIDYVNGFERNRGWHWQFAIQPGF